MKKRFIDLSVLNFSKEGNYGRTEFYPKNHIFASGEFRTENELGDIVPVSIVIMKVNHTFFESMRNGLVESCTGCRQLYQNDIELNDDYWEDKELESVMVSLSYPLHIKEGANEETEYKSTSYITHKLITICDILTSKSFLNELHKNLEKLKLNVKSYSMISANGIETIINQN